MERYNLALLRLRYDINLVAYATYRVRSTYRVIYDISQISTGDLFCRHKAQCAAVVQKKVLRNKEIFDFVLFREVLISL